MKRTTARRVGWLNSGRAGLKPAPTKSKARYRRTLRKAQSSALQEKVTILLRLRRTERNAGRRADLGWLNCVERAKARPYKKQNEMPQNFAKSAKLCATRTSHNAG